MSRSRAYQAIDAAGVVSTMVDTGEDVPLPRQVAGSVVTSPAGNRTSRVIFVSRQPYSARISDKTMP